MPHNSFSSPSIDYVLLGFLLPKPMHGYELHQDIQKMHGLKRVWTLKQAMLYAKLDKFEKEGLIAPFPEPDQSFIPPRKYFQLTEKGKMALESWIQQPVFKSRFMRQEFLAKLLLVRKLYPERLQGLLDKQIEVAQEWVKGLQSDSALNPENDQEDWMVTSFRLSQVQAMLDWLQKIRAKFVISPPTTLPN